MNFAAALRRELAERAHRYAQVEALPHCLYYGEDQIVCFAPYDHESRHRRGMAECRGCWVRDKEHGLQFKATNMKTVPPTTTEGIENRGLGCNRVVI